MKKVKILSLFLLVAMIFVTLTSCAGTGEAGSFNKLYNSKYVPEDLSYDKATALSDLDNYLITEMNEEFALFATGSEGALTYKVYSYASKSIIKTFTTDATVVYSVSLCGDLPVLYVTSTTFGGDEPVMAYKLYDAEGAELASTDKDPGAPIAFNDMLIFNRDIYELDKNGDLVKTEDSIPEYLSIVEFDTYNDDYVYVLGENNVNVYDRTFVPVSSWVAPTYAEDLSLYVIDNGNIFVQYVKALDANSTEYDFFEYTEAGNVEKFDLVSLVINAKNGSEKEVDLAFIVDDITCYEDFANISLVADAYNDGMKNLATIYPIVNGQIDTSDSAIDIVLLNDDCSSAKSLKLTDQQLAEIPVKLNKKLFTVETTYGSAIVKANGNVVYPITNSKVRANSQYLVGEKAIYDLEKFEVVYDLEEKKGEVIEVLNTALFIREGNVEESYKIIMLKDGEIKEICSYDVVNAKGKLFKTVLGIGCYSLYDATTAEYKYYNLDGKELATSKYALLPTAFSAKYDTMILCDLESGLGYYALTVEAEKK